MNKVEDFFNGITKMRYLVIIDTIVNGGILYVTDEEIEIINNNSTNIFYSWTEQDVEEFENVSEEYKKMLRWFAGLNTKEFLKIF